MPQQRDEFKAIVQFQQDERERFCGDLPQAASPNDVMKLAGSTAALDETPPISPPSGPLMSFLSGLHPKKQFPSNQPATCPSRLTPVVRITAWRTKKHQTRPNRRNPPSLPKSMPRLLMRCQEARCLKLNVRSMKLQKL